MPNLRFHIDDAEPMPFAATPTLQFKVRIENQPADQSLHAIILRCQLRIEPGRRNYQPTEKERLRDLFGEPDRWAQTCRNMFWEQVTVSVPAFSGSVAVDLPVPCTFDFNVAATKYFAGLTDGDVLVQFLFSGTIFYEGMAGTLQVAQVPWEKEASFRLPVSVWRQMMDHHHPNSAWLCLPREVFDRLYHLKIRRGLPTWEETVQALLDAEAEVTAP